MKNSNSIKILLIIQVLVIVFHLAIITKIIPYNLAWGGRIENDNQMFAFEIFSISLNLFLAMVLLMKAEYIRQYFKPRIIKWILWCFMFLFILNTIGNLLSKNYFEKFLSILTLTSALLIWKIIVPGSKKIIESINNQE